MKLSPTTFFILIIAILFISGCSISENEKNEMINQVQITYSNVEQLCKTFDNMSSEINSCKYATKATYVGFDNNNFEGFKKGSKEILDGCIQILQRDNSYFLTPEQLNQAITQDKTFFKSYYTNGLATVENSLLDGIKSINNTYLNCKCEDNDRCTKDYYDFNSGICKNDILIPCCGNGKAETGETCSSCAEDVKCSAGTQCCSDSCKDICTKDSDCISADPAKEGKCVNPNTCSAKCEYTTSTTAIIETEEYSVHGFKFEIDLEEYGNKVEYLDRSGDEQYLGAQDGQKLLKYRIIVQCIEDDCNSFYSSSFSLMDDEGNVYEAKCPINWLGQCNNQDTIDSMHNPLKNQKASGILIFSIPRNVNDIGLIYKFSSYMDKPTNLKFITELD